MPLGMFYTFNNVPHKNGVCSNEACCCWFTRLTVFGGGLNAGVGDEESY